MLKALIEKQLVECFRSYFVNRKTGKRRSKGKIAGLFIGFSVLMLFLGAFSFLMGMGLNIALYETPLGIEWLYYAVFGAAAMLMGVFGSVFNTYASLYLPKDNESLLAMPIKPSTILLSRLALVYLLSLLYSGVVWVPAVIASVVAGHATAASVVCGVLLTFVIALFVTVVTCALGWVIALVATRIRSKSVLVTLLGIAFFVCYEVLCFNLEALMDQMMKNIMVIAAGIQKFAGPLYTLGLAGQGDWGATLLFIGITAAMTALLLLIMSRTYTGLLLRKPKAAKGTYRMEHSRQRSMRKALLMRDFKRLTSSATYMMNSGFGAILLPILMVFVIIYRDKLMLAFNVLRFSFMQADQLVPAAVPLLIAMLTGMDAVSLPSVSLEGHSLWILQTMPVSGWQILRSKRDVHILVNLIPSVLAALVIDLMLGVSAAWILTTELFLILFTWFNADLGLWLGVQHADLKWTNETVVIKQNMWVLVVMAINLLLVALPAAGSWFLLDSLKPMGVMLVMSLLLAAAAFLTERWLKGKGSRVLMTL